MNRVGPIDGGASGREVGGRAKKDPLSRGRHSIEGSAALGQELLCSLVSGDLGEHVAMSASPPRVEVGLCNQLGDCVPAIAYHVGGNALGHGDDFSVYHQYPVVSPFNV